MAVRILGKTAQTSVLHSTYQIAFFCQYRP